MLCFGLAPLFNVFVPHLIFVDYFLWRRSLPESPLLKIPADCDLDSERKPRRRMSFHKVGQLFKQVALTSVSFPFKKLGAIRCQRDWSRLDKNACGYPTSNRTV